MNAPKATARRTRKEAGIYERADGTLEIGWRDASGRQRWRRVEGGVRAARAALSGEHARRARGEKIAADPRLRFETASDAWWAARVVKLRPATQSTYRNALNHLKRPENFGRSRLADITPTDVAQYVSRQQATGAKGWSIKGQVSVLSSIFNYSARHLGLVGVNPVSLLDKVERPSTVDQKSKRVLTTEELARLLGAVHQDRHRVIFELAAETGARLGEVLGVTWNDLDLKGQTVTFAAQLDRQGTRQPLKTTRSRRTVEITPVLVDKLKAHKAASGSLAGHSLAFTNREGHPHDHRCVTRVLAGAVKRAELDRVVDDQGAVVKEAPTFHSLRHSHASQLIAAGFDVSEISARLGHANVATTMSIYVHEFDVAGRSDDRRNRLAAIYNYQGQDVGLRLVG